MSSEKKSRFETVWFPKRKVAHCAFSTLWGHLTGKLIDFGKFHTSSVQQLLTSDERKKISIRIFQGQRRALHPLYEIHDWRDFPPILAIVNNLKKIQLNLEILDFSSLIKLYFEEIESKLKKRHLYWGDCDRKSWFMRGNKIKAP